MTRRFPLTLLTCVALAGCAVNGRVVNPLALLGGTQASREPEPREPEPNGSGDANERERQRQEKLAADQARWQAAQAERQAKAQADQERRQAEYEAERAAAKEKAEADRVAREREAAEEKVKQAELAKKAKTKRAFTIAELGLSIVVPGDVQAEDAGIQNYGTKTQKLEGDASEFLLFVSNADRDRFGLEERIRFYRTSEFQYGMTVIARRALPQGGWAFEFSYPQYDGRGNVQATYLGYFSHRVVAGKKVNCFVSGLDDDQLDDVERACQSLKVAAR